MASINETIYGKKLDPMLTEKDIMEHLHIKDRRTFNKLIDNGLPCIKIGRNYVIPQSKYEKWLQSYIGATVF